MTIEHTSTVCIPIACAISHVLYMYLLLCSFHNNLKTHYLDGKVNRRVDYLLIALLDIENDFFFTYNQKRILGGLNPRVLREEDRHQRGMSIPTASLQVKDRYYSMGTRVHPSKDWGVSAWPKITFSFIGNGFRHMASSQSVWN